jgi:hypothetical protein
MAGGLTEPSKGEFYQQEFDQDNAEDWGKVLNFVPIDDFEDHCLKTKEESRRFGGIHS